MSDFWKNWGQADKNNGLFDLTKTGVGANMTADEINKYRQGYGG